jgi:hypothetical protein
MHPHPAHAEIKRTEEKFALKQATRCLPYAYAIEPKTHTRCRVLGAPQKLMAMFRQLSKRNHRSVPSWQIY